MAGTSNVSRRNVQDGDSENGASRRALMVERPRDEWILIRLRQ